MHFIITVKNIILIHKLLYVIKLLFFYKLVYFFFTRVCPHISAHLPVMAPIWRCCSETDTTAAFAATQSNAIGMYIYRKYVPSTVPCLPAPPANQHLNVLCFNFFCSYFSGWHGLYSIQLRININKISLLIIWIFNMSINLSPHTSNHTMSRYLFFF